MTDLVRAGSTAATTALPELGGPVLDVGLPGAQAPLGARELAAEVGGVAEARDEATVGSG